MKHSDLLRRFEYSIPASKTEIYDRSSLGSQFPDTQLPSVKINIDFEKSNLSLQGDAVLAINPERKSALPGSASAKERIEVKARFHSGINIDLSNLANDGLIFPLEGTIRDNSCLNPCSGLLALDRAPNLDQPSARGWYLTVYVFDDYRAEREIKLKLTMYSFAEYTQLN